MPILGSRGAASIRNFGFGGVGRPAAPVNVTATRQTNGSITVSFSPSYNGGLAVTSFTAVSSPGNITASSASTSINVTGLTLGTAYTFVVFATNALGNSVNSQASNSQVAATPPSTPTIGTATVASPTSVTVSYTASSSNNGEPITSYTAVSTPGGITATLNQATSGTITVTGLTSGTTYTFRVFATNVMGNSANSNSSNSVKPDVPTYTVSSNLNANVGGEFVSEGETASFFIDTNETTPSRIIYWGVTGGVTAADLGVSALTGSVNTVANSRATISFPIAADLTTEGTETFVIRFYTNSTRTILLSDSSVSGKIEGSVERTVSIADTSTTPAPTYSISVVNELSSTTIGEGESSRSTFTVTTTNFGNGTLYWTASGTNITASDFTQNTLSGSVTITNDSGSFSLNAAADNFTEGAESFRVALRTGSTSGTIVAFSSFIGIADFSTTPLPTLNISFTLGYNWVIFGPNSNTQQYFVRGNWDGTAGGTQNWSISRSGLTVDTGVYSATSGTWSGSTTNSILTFQSPHSAGSATITVTRTGYQTFTQTLSVPANALYSPYNFSRGFPQEASNLTALQRSWSEQIANSVYESISTAYTVPIAPGGFTTWYGLGRRIDFGGAEFWPRWCTDNGTTPGTSSFYNGFFTAVNAAGSGNLDYQSARTNSKSFRPGTGYNKFGDRP